MVSEIAVGIVGYGRIGAEHAGWLGRAAGVRVAGVYDPTAARRELARGRGLEVVGSLEELFARCGEGGAVLVSTPTRYHFEHAGAALRAGKHVMVEKPAALDLAETEALQAMAGGRMLSVFHNRRWDPDFLAVRALVASGRLGRVFNVESRLGQWASCVGPAAREWRPGWRNEAAYGGGGLYDWGSHFIDQLQLLMRPATPVRVFAQLRGNVWTADCDDLARVLIDFSDGTAAVCEINTTTRFPRPRWLVEGTEGSASSPHSPEFDTAVWAKLEVRGGTEGRAVAEEPRLDEVAIWERFARACRGGGRPAVEVESVVMTMRLLDAARASAREGRAVDVSGVAE